MGRKSPGQHSDPTALLAIRELEGVTVWIPETVRYPAALVADLLASLPAHLGEPLRLVLVEQQTPAAAANAARLGQATVRARIDQALDRLAALLYGPRWEPS
jgi:DNA-directed RNA polymerase specialized sigma24 family protein